MSDSKIRVGLTVIASIILLYLILAWGTNSGFWAEEAHRYLIEFENVDGLLEGDPVDVRGYRSGKVLNIVPGSQNVRVEISLNPSIQLRKDAFAEIQVKELMGGKQISIQPGIGSEILAVGSSILGKKALDFSSAFSKIGDGLDKIDFDKLNTVFYRLDTLSQKLTSTANAIQPQDLAQLIARLNRATNGVNTFVNELNNKQLVAKIDTAISDFGMLATSAEVALARIDTLAQNLDSHTLPRADTLMEQLGIFLTKTEKSLESADGLFRQLKDTSTVAGKLLYDPVWSNTIDASIANLNKTLTHIRRHKIHVTLSLSGKKKTYED